MLCSRLHHKLQEPARCVQAFPLSSTQVPFASTAVARATSYERKSTLLENSSVCQLHFAREYVSRYFVHTVRGQEVRIPRERPRLAQGALPFASSQDQRRSSCTQHGPQGAAQVPPLVVPCGESDGRSQMEHSSTKRKFSEESTDDEHSRQKSLKTNAEGCARRPDFHQEAQAEDHLTSCSWGSADQLQSLKKPNGNWAMLVVPNVDGVFYVTSRLRVDRFDLYHDKAVFFESTDTGILSRTYLNGKVHEEKEGLAHADAEDELKRAEALLPCPKKTCAAPRLGCLRSWLRHCVATSKSSTAPAAQATFWKKAQLVQHARRQGLHSSGENTQ